jgi:hypothetical protein
MQVADVLRGSPEEAAPHLLAVSIYVRQVSTPSGPGLDQRPFQC